MTPSWFVRVYKEGDEKGILDLMNPNHDALVNERWLWEYKNNPLGQFIGVADHEGKIVGHMAMIPTYMKIGDKKTLGSQAVDLYVHKDFRRQGMFIVIGKMLTSEAGRTGIDVSYGFPNELAHSGHLKYGWFDVCEVPMLIKPINMKNVVRLLNRNRVTRYLNKYGLSRSILRLMLQFRFTVDATFSRVFNKVERTDNRGGLGNVDIHAVELFDDRINDFWNHASTDYQIAVARDQTYLNWRYFRKPNAKYNVLVAEGNGRVLGYIVSRSVIEKNLKFGYIVDVFASKNNDVLINSLVMEALKLLRKEEVDLFACWMLKDSSSARAYYRILRHNGFVNASSNALIARVNSPKASKDFVKDSKNWYITIGDSDII